jgi:hypothetical protein
MTGKLMVATIASFFVIAALAACVADNEPNRVFFLNQNSIAYSLNGNEHITVKSLIDGTQTDLTFEKKVKYLHLKSGHGGVAVDEDGKIGIFGWPKSSSMSEKITFTYNFRHKEYTLGNLLSYTSFENHQAAVFSSGHALVSLPDRPKILVLNIPELTQNSKFVQIRLQSDQQDVGYLLTVAWENGNSIQVFQKAV